MKRGRRQAVPFKVQGLGLVVHEIEDEAGTLVLHHVHDAVDKLDEVFLQSCTPNVGPIGLVVGGVQRCTSGKHIRFEKGCSKMTASLPEATISRTEVGDDEEGHHSRNERIAKATVKGEINSSMFQKKVDAGSNQNVEEAKRKNLGPHGALQLEDHGEMVPGIGKCREERSRTKERY